MNAYSTTRTTTTTAKTTAKAAARIASRATARTAARTAAAGAADSKLERLFSIFGNEVRRALEIVGAAYRNAPLRLL